MHKIKFCGKVTKKYVISYIFICFFSIFASQNKDYNEETIYIADIMHVNARRQRRICSTFKIQQTPL